MGNEQSAGQGGYRADYRQHSPLPPRNETKAEEAERLNRAAAYDDKLRRFQRKDPEQVKKENWAKYQAIGTAKPANANASASAANSTNASPPQPAAPSLSANAPPPPAHFNTASAASRPPPQVVQAGYPGPTAGYQPPRRPVTGGAGYVGTAAVASQQLPADPNRARAARAAAMEAKTAKIKTYSKGGGKSDQWETYKQLEALEQQKNAPVAARHSLHNDSISSTSPSPTSDEKREDNPATASNTDDASAAAAAASYGGDESDGDAFYQQMFHLIQKAQRMPAASLQLLIRILSNLVRADPSDPNAAKYRRLKLDNDKVQAAIVAVDGALEVLFAVGFERREGGEGDGGEAGGMSGERLECVTEDMTMAMLALEKLNAVLESRK